MTDDSTEHAHVPTGGSSDDLEERLLAHLETLSGQSGVADAADARMVLARARSVRDAFTRVLLSYQCAIDEVATKIAILRRDFEATYDYGPIEHVRTRLKSPDSLLDKALRQGTELTAPAVREEIRDIAGIRITCSFVSDVYWIAEMLSAQPDLRLLTTKDYIADPKPNGYRSLHLILEVPVFLSDRTEHVPVELQIRAIAMDFWASTEHKLAYKYRTDMPPELAAELDDAARVAAELDARMGRLRDQVRPSPHGTVHVP